MRSAIAIQFRQALAFSLLFHAAMIGLAVFIAAQRPGMRDREYIAVDLVQPSGGGERTYVKPDQPPVTAPGKEPQPQEEVKQDLSAKEVTGLVSKVPEPSSAAPFPAQSESQPSGDIPGSPRAGNGYQPIQRISRVPSFKVQMKPVYPPSERAAGIEARVIVEVYINETGMIDDVKLIKSGGLPFDQAVMKAVQNCSFEPGYRDDKPVPVRVQIPYSFKLR
jgi:TonB family protein